MNVRDAETAFLEFLRDRGEHLSRLTPATGPAAMLAFFGEVRAKGCRFEDDQDSLLFQWGRRRRGDETVFVYDLTRQFIAGDGEDGDIWQLSLAFEVPVATAPAALRDLVAGDRWCASLDELAAFTRFLEDHPATEAFQNGVDAPAMLTFDCAG